MKEKQKKGKKKMKKREKDIMRIIEEYRLNEKMKRNKFYSLN